jgi:hypothetical protein
MELFRRWTSMVFDRIEVDGQGVCRVRFREQYRELSPSVSPQTSLRGGALDWTRTRTSSTFAVQTSRGPVFLVGMDWILDRLLAA